MTKKKFGIIAIVLLLSIFATACGGVQKQQDKGTTGNTNKSKTVAYPTKPIKMIVPWSAGGGTDTATRILAKVVAKYMPNGQHVIVENVTGGGGTVGINEVVKADPDGYTLGMTTVGPLSYKTHLSSTPYHFTDVTPIMRLINNSNVLVVRNDAPWQNFDQWLKYVKNNPGKFKFGVPGIGIAPDIAMEAVNHIAGLKTKAVPFHGTAPTITAVLGGHVDGAMVQASEAKPYTDSGKLRVIAITGKSKIYPNATQFADKGINVHSDVYTGIIGPKNLPDQIVNILLKAFKAAYDDPELKQKFDQTGSYGGYGGPKDFKKSIQNEYDSSGKVMKSLGLLK